MEAKKINRKDLPKALLYTATYTFRNNPLYLLLNILSELSNRTLPFVEAYIFGKVVSELPSAIDVKTRSLASDNIVRLLAFYVTAKVVSQIIDAVLKYFISWKQAEISLQGDRQIMEKYARLPFEDYDSKEVADQYEMARRFSYQAGTIFVSTTRDVLGSLYSFAVAFVAFLTISKWAAVAIVLAYIPAIWLELKTNDLQRQTWRSNSVTRRRAWAYEDLFRPSIVKETRLLQLTNFALSKWHSLNLKEKTDSLRIDRQAERYRSLLRVSESLLEVGVLFAVIRKIASGAAEIGSFVFMYQALSQYMRAMSGLIYTLRNLDEQFAGFNEFILFMSRVDRGLAQLDYKGKAPHIKLEKVSFAYPQTKKEVLKNISIDIPYGSTVAIVGENGAGKTTLVKLIMGIYRPKEGTVSVDGVAVHEIKESQWLGSIGVLFQDFVNFSDFTVKESVHFGNITAPFNRKLFKTALEQSGSASFVAKLPKKDDTYMNKWMDEENGTSLSGGQSQRLAIARSLYRQAPILIMDEPTSAIDAKAEYEIFKNLESSRLGKTTILISHRFSTVRKANYIIVLSGGVIAEAGTHEDLMKKKAKYYQLFTLQAEGYK